MTTKVIQADREAETLKPLEPCPFCGCQGSVYERHNPMSRWKWSVDCSSSTCGMSGPVEASKADAITAWNTRASHADPLRRALEEVREVLASGYRDAEDAPRGFRIRALSETIEKALTALSSGENKNGE